MHLSAIAATASLPVAWLLGLLLTAAAGSVGAQNATVPGAITTPFPTLRHLTVEWAIAGDLDEDGAVAVRYRRSGEAAWRQGLPLRRIPAGSNAGFDWDNRHSGSVFELSPGTAYEIELTLVDPDGGSAVQTVSASTRPVPAPMVNAPLRPVTPATLASVIASAQPGEILLFQPGSYPGFTFQRDGNAGQPIVLRGLPGAVITGELGLFTRRHVHLDRLRVDGRIRFNGSNDIVITRCTVNASPTQFDGHGIVALLRAENAYIADNTVIGTTAWVEAAMGASGANRGEGIWVTGPGHVIEYNRVHGFRDNISLHEGAGSAVDQFSIDIIGNELSEGLDDAIEADYCFHNCRLIGNRSTNAFIAFSSQPGLGGPTWFIRNAAYNVAHVAFKLHNSSVGDVLLHNTVVKAGDGLAVYTPAPIARLFSRNNLFLGGPGGTVNGYDNGSGRVAEIASLVTAGSSLDHDAWGSTVGSFSGRLGAIQFSSLAQMRALTSAAHAVQIDGAAFAQAITFPGAPLTQYAPVDLRLAAGSAAIDAGAVLTNINDEYSGGAPDAGAYEAGMPLPWYGPRPDLPDTIFSHGFEA